MTFSPWIKESAETKRKITLFLLWILRKYTHTHTHTHIWGMSASVYFHSYKVQFSSVQSLSPVWLFATPWTAAHQGSLSITSFQSLLKLMSIESVMPSNHLFLCHSFLLLPSIFLSIRVFSNESVFHIRWPKYWSLSFNISSSNEYSGLISFKTNWFDLLAVQRTLKSLLNTTVQNHKFFDN